MAHKAKIFEYLDQVATVLPAPIYWADTNGVVLGANEICIKAMGANSYEEVVGKTPYDYYPYDIADSIIKHVKKVIQEKITLSQEDIITDITTGKTRYYIAVRSPLYENGQIVGIIGTSVETTSEKEATFLRIENEAHKVAADEQTKFRKVVDQVAHDIRSPIATLLMVVNSAETSKEIPEDTRVTIRDSANRINDIANNLLSKYDNKQIKSTESFETQVREPFMVSKALQQILTAKKHEYKSLKITFDHNFSQKSIFAFILMQSTAFKQMISNLINNAVDSFNGKLGFILIKLDSENNRVTITIEDNGSGMPSDVVNKIMNNIPVTCGKQFGHGIGFTQVRETLQHNDGKIQINSEINVGTKITLTFPQVDLPDWIIDKIELNHEDLIIILDDDPSIHGAWRSKFNVDAPELKLKHFEIGEEAINFINNLPQEQKSKVFLLTDFELLGQEINGLDVIAQTKIKRSILVTSHSENKDVQKLAAKTQTRILPKLLASVIPICVLGEKNITSSSISTKSVKNINNNTNISSAEQTVDVVLLDDNELFLSSLAKFAFRNKIVNTYTHPDKLLDEITKYDKNTLFCIDNDLGESAINGIALAEKLHKMGYIRLYLLSGTEFTNSDQLPDYLNIVLKNDMSAINKLKDLI